MWRTKLQQKQVAASPPSHPPEWQHSFLLHMLEFMLIEEHFAILDDTFSDKYTRMSVCAHEWPQKFL